MFAIVLSTIGCGEDDSSILDVKKDGGVGWSWRQTSGPGGGYINKLVTSSSGDIFATTYHGGIFRSTDNGDSWHAVNSGISNLDMYAITIDATGHLYAGSYTGELYRSENSGTTWDLVFERDIKMGFNCLATTSSGTVIGSVVGTTDEGIYRSLDAGHTWKKVITGLAISVSSVSVTSNDEIWVTGSGWTGSGLILRSNDEGDNWFFYTDLGLPLWGVSDLAFVDDPPDSGTIFAINSTGVYRYTGTASWEEVSEGLSTSSVNTIAVDQDGYLYVGTDRDGIFVSKNRGDSWEQTNNGLIDMQVSCLGTNKNGYVFVGAEGGQGISRSIDSGQNWELANGGLCNTSVESIAINADDQVFASVEDLGVFRSVDNGESWETVNEGLTRKRIGVMAINSSGHIFAGVSELQGNDGGVFRSVDNGSTWESLGLDAWSVVALIVSSAEDIIANGVLRLTNDGDTWEHVHESIGAREFAMNSSGDLFAATYSGIYHSTDDGDTWALVTDQGARRIICNRNGILFAGTEYDAGVIRSEDNGITWEPANDGLTDGRVLCLAINSIDHIFAGTRDGVFCSSDHGTSWQPANDGVRHLATELSVNSQGYLVAGTAAGGVYISRSSTE